MISTGIDQRVKIQQIIENQLPEFVLSESPKSIDFFKQYYISQEFPGGPVDIAENLDQYLKIDNLTPEVVRGYTNLVYDINESVGIITVCSTKGFPDKYGLIKIDDEIITYTGITTNSFSGCVRGFSGITNYHKTDKPDELVFSTSVSASHTGTNDCTATSSGTKVYNLSSLFLQEFYKKLKGFLTPGLEDVDFISDLDVSNFIKNARSFYQSKGTEESFRILFNVLYGETPKVIDLEQFLLKPSSGKFIKREVIVSERISGDPTKLIGQTIISSLDPTIIASVSEVEVIIRRSKLYYKIGLFVGYDDLETTNNSFFITGKTKVLEDVSVDSQIISVDSTIGFGQTGTLLSGTNVITYSNKSVNQFFGCVGISTQIDTTDDIISNQIIYGYENGDLSKKVELRITGVITDFIPENDISLVEEGDIISVKSIGESVSNSESDKSFKQIFSNSWIYNTSSRYQVESFSSQTLTLKSNLIEGDNTSLKVGDYVEILERGTQNVVPSNELQVSSITSLDNQISLVGSFSVDSNRDYDIRRKIKKTSFLFTGEERELSLEYGDNQIIADVQNVYFDGEKYGFVASNSLPNYPLDIDITYAEVIDLDNFNNITQTYSTFIFESNVPFVTGDLVVYDYDSEPISGLSTSQLYYVEVLDPNNTIRLYDSKSFIGTDDFTPVFDIPSGSHKFILSRYSSKILSPQKILRKFPLERTYSDPSVDEVGFGGIGLSVNGVEIFSPISDDKVYYGPINDLILVNGGDDYDVINPPVVSISTSPNSGTNALANLVVTGSVQKVLVDPQNFDISDVISVTISGGNGSGAIFDPIVSKRSREIEFDTDSIFFSGGIDLSEETITFLDKHNFENCERIIYNENGNSPLGIGSYFGVNSSPIDYLVNGSAYYARVINSSTIKLHKTLSDCYSGINTIGFTTSNSPGIHKFRTTEKNYLTDIKVLNPGSGYENRTLRVKSSGISTSKHTVHFKNHNFKDGDLIQYYSTGSTISGLSSTSNYYILKLDSDNFRLAYAGIGTDTVVSNYNNKIYEKFNTQGTGYQVFRYPDIQLTVNVSYGSSLTGIITATPVVRGHVTDIYLYEPGTGYGSEILNLEKKPIISIKNGKNAEVKPIISNGRIQRVEVTSRGSEYISDPDLIISGDGSGAILKPIVSSGQVIGVVVIKSGSGYSASKTSIRVVPPGKNLNVISSIRQLHLNKNNKYTTETLIDGDTNIEYGYIGYSIEIGRDIFGDVVNPTVPFHSPIIGWAYDGNPIYGPYGYSDPQDNNSLPKVLKTGYVLDTSNVDDRPSGFPGGYFVEDYKFDGSGDLDQYNGRFCKTKDFPNGTYAYFATVSPTNVLIPEYPYFIGKEYRSQYISENDRLNQSFDFNNSDLLRNTYPYRVDDIYSNNDFLIEPNDVIDQLSVVDSITRGTISSFDILSPGQDYKIGDYASFDEENTGGGGISAVVSEIEGKEILNLETSYTTYSNSLFNWTDQNTVTVIIDPNHELINNDSVIISGLSTYIPSLNGVHKIGVSTENITLFSDIPINSGIVTDVYVSNINNKISIGSSLQIENEIVKVLNVYGNSSVLRIKRFNVGSAHTSSTPITLIPNKFTIPVKTKYFDSIENDLIYFNPKQSVGVGTTTGISVGVGYSIGQISNEISIPTQSIYLPNHPFKTGQPVIFGRETASSLLVKNTSSSTSFNLPQADTQVVYIINKSKDYVGLTTQVGLTTNTNGLYFASNGDDFYEYYLQSDYAQVTGKVDKITTKVSLSTAHNLENNDIVTLIVNPNLSVGVGTSDYVRVKYKESYNKILINPIGFTSVGVNTNTNIITINSHELKTGDKVFYDYVDSPASGLNIGEYFIYKVDDNQIQLVNSYSDTQSTTPDIVNIISIGGSRQEISAVNPQIISFKNNNLVFDTSDSSLDGYNFKIFYDSDFNKEFLTTLDGFNFNIDEDGDTFTLNYSDGLPTKLYYSIEKDGEIVEKDSDVVNGNQILFVNSYYNNTYSVFGVGSTSFNVCASKLPERLNYTSEECDILKYTTTSKNTTGGVTKLKIISKGVNYKKIPEFTSISSEDGRNAIVVPKSTNIGKIKKTRVLEQGFEYSSDKTLRPEAFISPTITITDSTTITGTEIVSGGEGYTSSPRLIIIDSETREVVSEDALNCEVYSGSISNISINVQPYGLRSANYEVIAIDNSNGVFISTVSSSTNTIRCFLTQPLAGFSTNVFDIGEEVFLENIETQESSGTGFNSADYGYQFFTVTDYLFEPPQVVLSTVGLTTNPGIAKTNQTNFPTIIKRSRYPKINTIQELSDFKIGEQVLVKNGSVWIQQDLYVSNSRKNSLKFNGTYKLIVGDIIKGSESGVICTIQTISENKGIFDTNYSILQNYGWSSDIGKLNETSQVTPDNDYYQNLSYTVKSKIEFEKSIDAVNRLVHTSGLKNFSDTEIINSSKVGIGSTGSDVVVVDIIDENRVDSIYNYDLVVDIDSYENKTKTVQFKNKKLTGYIDCISNRVLNVDDISEQFQSRGTNTNEVGTEFIKLLPLEGSFGRYLVQIVDPNGNNRQLTEIITTNYGSVCSTLEKATLTNTNVLLSDLVAEINEFGEKYIKLSPTDPINQDLDIKVIQDVFNSELTGIGTTSFGFIDLIGSNVSVSSGSTSTIVSYNLGEIESVHLGVQVINTTTNLMQYTELFVTHDGVNETYFTEYYFDNSASNYSELKLSEFTPSITSGILNINVYNTSTNSILVRSKIVGFGSTSLGNGTYRYKFAGQLDGSERSAYLDATYISTGITTNIVTIDSDIISSLKSTVRVSYGDTSALHQVMMVTDGTEVYTMQYPFLSIGSTTGIGTFGGQFLSGSLISLKFYPDDNIIDDLLIQSYNEILYTENDIVNQPPEKVFGSVTESIVLNQFDALNGSRVNKLSFEFNYNGIPIYVKSFDPSNINILNTETGVFTINDHFFSNLEEIKYTPKSTFVGVAASAIGIGNTLDYTGIVTNILPSKLYVIKINNDQFRLSTRKEYAASGIGISITSVGSGNAHTLDMSKKLEKTVVSIDGIVQKPITFIPISYSLKSNVSSSSTYFGISGISTIKQNDLLKIDDEIIRVLSVGVGTTSSGPISSSGSENVVSVERNYLGSSAVSHNIGTSINVYRGSYNIVDNKIYFTDPPTGSGNFIDRRTNLEFPKSQFSGRVYLRDNYTTNQIYDDISYQFTGIGQTYTLTVQGINTSGISTGDGVLFINNVFQTPTTENNTNNNYSLITSSGISSVVFSGISTLVGGQVDISEFDVNQNLIPRGGIIVSLGSTPGLGFAPLVGVNTSDLRIILGAGNSITSVGFSSNRFGSGYYGSTISIGVTDLSHTGTAATITASIGAGGSITKFNVIFGGSGYQNPYLEIPQPSYSNLEVVGVSRLGLGSTSTTGNGLLLTLDVGPSSTTGIGSTLFEVKTFKIARQGYGFKIGDVFKPVGLVTSRGLSSPLADFELTVLDTFEDNFYFWQFGEFDYIDSIKFLQNGVRTRFPLIYNGNLRSFETIPDSDIDLNSVLLIFINGVLQNPGESYTFDGGTSFIFSNPPRPEDNISIFFYRGTRDIDSIEKEVYETIKPGDIIQIQKSSESSTKQYQIFEPEFTGISVRVSSGSSIIKVNSNVGIGTSSLKVGQNIEQIIDVIPNNTNIVSIGTENTITINKLPLNSIDLDVLINVGSISTAYESLTYAQDPRTVYNILSSDTIDTNIYTGVGITELYYRPLTWTKQKVDKVINGEFIYKSRDFLETRITPTAKIIRTVFANDKEFFVDDARFFDYDTTKYLLPSLSVNSFDVLIVGQENKTTADLSAVVSTAGTVQSLLVNNPGVGYTGTSLEVKIGLSTSSGGIRATATVPIVNGSISSPANITNPGSGYSSTNPPQVIIQSPFIQSEIVTSINDVQGFSGIITGITTATGIGTNLALKFFLRADPPHALTNRDAQDSGNFIGLSTNYPIYIYDTVIGSGVTSIDRSNTQTVGIGTTFLDNVYIIHAGTSLNSSDPTAEIICNIDSRTSVTGLSTYASTSSVVGLVGRFSWGRISGSGLSRSSNPISIGVSGYTINSGLTTFPSIVRKNYGFRESGSINKISNNPNN